MSASAAGVDPTKMLRLSTETLMFNNARANVLYTRRLEMTNPLPAPMELTIKSGSPERYVVEPSSLTIAPHATEAVEVRLKMTTLPAARRGGASGPLRDTFLIKSSFGVQRFAALLVPYTGQAPAARDEEAADNAGAPVAAATLPSSIVAVDAAAVDSAETSATAGLEHAGLEHTADLQRMLLLQAQQLSDQEALLQLTQQRSVHEMALQPHLDAAQLRGEQQRLAPQGGVLEQLRALDQSNQALQQQVAM